METVTALFRAGPRQPAFERASLVTLFAVFLYSDKWTSKLAHVVPVPAIVGGIVVLIAAAIGFRCQRRPVFWFALAAAMFVALSTRWWTTDDHVFLLAYWLVAVGLAALEADPSAALAFHARLLLGLVFLFATLWKVVTPAYANGSMFHLFLLIDPRFTRITEWVGAVPADALRENFVDAASLRSLAEPAGTVLRDAPAVSTVANVLTWATVAIEGALAAVFLLPSKVPQPVRDLLLLAFLVGTYLLAPVLLFGVLLVAMGVAQAHPRAVILYLLALSWIYLMAAFFRA